MTPTTLLRLQHFLAKAGVASRRRAEELILAGKVKVNGKVVRELGSKVHPKRDRVTYDGRHLFLEETTWLVMSKPDATVTSAHDPEGRRTVLDLLGDQPTRLYPVGRLDYHTTGVLILTNDGTLAAALTHPRHEIPRVYHVKVRATLTEEQVARLEQGIQLPDVVQPCVAKVNVLGTTGKHTWIELTIRQGANRQIHRMLEAVGATVLRLRRVSFAGITDEGLRPGEFRPLTDREVKQLRLLCQQSGPPRVMRQNSARAGAQPRSKRR